MSKTASVAASQAVSLKVSRVTSRIQSQMASRMNSRMVSRRGSPPPPLLQRRTSGKDLITPAFVSPRKSLLTGMAPTMPTIEPIKSEIDEESPMSGPPSSASTDTYNETRDAFDGYQSSCLIVYFIYSFSPFYYNI